MTRSYIIDYINKQLEKTSIVRVSEHDPASFTFTLTDPFIANFHPENELLVEVGKLVSELGFRLIPSISGKIFWIANKLTDEDIRQREEDAFRRDAADRSDSRRSGKHGRRW